MFGRPLRVQPTKEGYTVLYGKTVFLKVSKGGLAAFLADLDSGVEFLIKKPKKRKRPKTLSAESETDVKTRALQFSKAYSKEKKAHFHAGAVKEISPKEKAFKYFVNAIPIIERHKVTYRKFIRAQIYGLKWTNNGKGQFPTPSMLATESAETRLMEYMQNITENRAGKPICINLTKEERSTPLTKNHTYIAYAKKVKDRIATLNETLYVQELQLVRKGEIRDWVKSHLETVATD